MMNDRRICQWRELEYWDRGRHGRTYACPCNSRIGARALWRNGAVVDGIVGHCRKQQYQWLARPTVLWPSRNSQLSKDRDL